MRQNVSIQLIVLSAQEENASEMNSNSYQILNLTKIKMWRHRRTFVAFFFLAHFSSHCIAVPRSTFAVLYQPQKIHWTSWVLTVRWRYCSANASIGYMNAKKRRKCVAGNHIVRFICQVMKSCRSQNRINNNLSDHWTYINWSGKLWFVYSSLCLCVERYEQLTNIVSAKVYGIMSHPFCTHILVSVFK